MRPGTHSVQIANHYRANKAFAAAAAEFASDDEDDESQQGSDRFNARQECQASGHAAVPKKQVKLHLLWSEGQIPEM